MLTVNDTNSPSFGQVNLIRISKKAFKNPEKGMQCSKEFINGINKAKGNILGSLPGGFYIQQLLYKFGKKNKSATALLGNHNNMPIKASLEEGYHSFAFFTGNDNDVYTDLYKKNKKQIIKDVNNNLKNAKYTDNDGNEFKPNFKQFFQIRLGLIIKKISEIQQKAFEDADIKEFRINNLDELKSIVEKLG